MELAAHLPGDPLEILLVPEHSLIRGQHDLKLGVLLVFLLATEEELMLPNQLAIFARAAVLDHILQPDIRR